MPYITAETRQLEDGQYFTRYFNTADTGDKPHNFKVAQDFVRIVNRGSDDIIVTVSGTSKTIKPGREDNFQTAVSGINMRSVAGIQPFMVETWSSNNSNGGVMSGGGATVTYDPPSLAASSGSTSSAFTVTGASVGDQVELFPPYSTQGIMAFGYVDALDTVKISLWNSTSGAIDLPSGAWTIKLNRSSSVQTGGVNALYNAAALQPYKDSLSLSSSQIVDVLTIGDSITRGQQTTDPRTKAWPKLLSDKLQTKYGVCGEGWYAAYPDWTFTGAGWSWVTNNGGFGNAYARGVATSAGQTGTITFTGISVDLLGVAISGGGTANVKIDGVDKGSISFANATDDFTKKFSFTGLTDTSHTLVITPDANSGEIRIQGVFANRGTTGARMNRNGVSGSKAQDWNRPTTTLAAWAAVSPKLVTIAFGTNECNTNAGTANFKSHMTSLINYWKGRSVPVVLIAMPQYSTVLNPNGVNYKTYVDAGYELADTNNVALIDLYKKWNGSFDYANGLGFYYSDGLHPIDAGHADIANTLAQYLL